MIELAIFDMDGLMIDSERTFLDSIMAVSKRDGDNIDRDLMIASMGMNQAKMKEFITAGMPEGFNFDDLFKRYIDYRLVYEKENPPAVKKGLFELISFLKKNGIRIAIATSTYYDRAVYCLKNSGIDPSIFDFIKAGDQIINSKPHPEIYLSVLEHFGVSADSAVVFEDSKNGLLSSSAADIRCIVVPDIAVIDEMTLKKAYRIVKSLDEAVPLIEELNT